MTEREKKGKKEPGRRHAVISRVPYRTPVSPAPSFLIVIDVYMRSRASVTSVSNVYALGMTLCGVFLRYGHSRGGIPYEPTYTR